MTSVVALVLAFLFFGLKPIHVKNEAVYNKKAILSAIADHLDTDFSKISDEDVQSIFDTQIEQAVIDMSGNTLAAEKVAESGYPGGKAEDVDMAKEKKKPKEDQILPVFIYSKKSGEKYYILSVRGNGLWDEIWGCVALEGDLNTIAGVAFDHKAETPGLGAEIKDNPAWKGQFEGKTLYDNSGQFMSIDVVKGGADDSNMHAVDGLTGATITANGVDEMLERGLQYYQPYFDKIN
jgi:Na+-transporting NADH:ubiquinone oxidoreductase subunit C